MLQYSVNKCVFSRRLKLSLPRSGSLKLSGREFQSDGPATEKARGLSMQSRQRGTTNRRRVVDWRCCEYFWGYDIRVDCGSMHCIGLDFLKEKASKFCWTIGAARCLVERCKLPQRGSGQSHGRKRIWCTLKLSESHWWQYFLYFEVDVLHKFAHNITEMLTRSAYGVTGCCWLLMGVFWFLTPPSLVMF